MQHIVLGVLGDTQFQVSLNRHRGRRGMPASAFLFQRENFPRSFWLPSCPWPELWQVPTYPSANQDLLCWVPGWQRSVDTRTKCQGSDSKDKGVLGRTAGGSVRALSAIREVGYYHAMCVEGSHSRCTEKKLRELITVNTTPRIYKQSQVPVGSSTHFPLLLSETGPGGHSLLPIQLSKHVTNF